tara:strand:- start:547 stop:801 length:255 start_codon:yes stop_codon:yes gene_type:complete
MSHFGDLLKGGDNKVTPKPQPVVEKPAPPAPLVVEGEKISKQELMKLSKIQLEELGREHGIELDRRISHAKLVVQLKSFIDSKS